METVSNKKEYDLEERTFVFAKEVRFFVRNLPKTITFIEDIKQVVRSSGSVGANYIEANESLGKKDFLMKIKISRKIAKETIYWLKLIHSAGIELGNECSKLIQEAKELTMILSAILSKSQ